VTTELVTKALGDESFRDVSSVVTSPLHINDTRQAHHYTHTHTLTRTQTHTHADTDADAERKRVEAALERESLKDC
jgi:hypothetical protein